jgi:hypothetical protein
MGQKKIEKQTLKIKLGENLLPITHDQQIYKLNNHNYFQRIVQLVVDDDVAQLIVVVAVAEDVVA